MMLNLHMKQENKANKFIQHIFLLCARYMETSRSGCDLAVIPVASPSLLVYFS